MKVLTEGHKYSLKQFESQEEDQIIQFIEKTPFIDLNGNPTTELVTVNDGTTNEEVLEMLIDRMKYLYNKFPSNETKLAIEKCSEAKFWLEERTKDRTKRNVEGKQLK